MPVDSIQVKQFSVFQNISLEFSPGLNVFIGENSTGKTHLMKLLYALLRPFQESFSGISSADAYKRALQDKLIALFNPDEDSAGRLVHRRVGRAKATVSLAWQGERLGFSLTTLGNLTVAPFVALAKPSSVFLPSREALAMFPGFIAAYENRELSFDATYYDLCKALSGVPLRGPRLALANELIKSLEDVIGGRVVLQGNRFYVESKEGKLEAPLLAEGYRKIASVVHLIVNGSLVKNGVLFWDEPEANLNPKLVVRIAQVLRALVAGGVQVFVTTHDFLLSQELSLAVEYKTEPQTPTRFFAFSRKEKRLEVQSGQILADLDSNPIVQEFAAHYRREQDLISAPGGAEGTK